MKKLINRFFENLNIDYIYVIVGGIVGGYLGALAARVLIAVMK